MPLVRVRQHVNPLADKYQQPIAPPSWEQVYANLAQPFLLDIGSARGNFLLQIAQQQPDWNFLGLEIREPLVDRANLDRDQLGLTNLHFLFCNANIALRPVLESLPVAQLHRVTIQFPDPWFKKRHQKRRVVQPDLVQTLADFLPTGAEVFLQSDIETVARQMGDRFQEHPAFTSSHEAQWLTENPLPVMTEREMMTLDKGQPVFRRLFLKQTIPELGNPA